MKETIEAAFSVINIIPTTLLILILLYWLTVIIGIFDIDSLDLGDDLDLNVGESIMWLNSATNFFNLGKIPLMLVLSIFSISLWMISLVVNDFFHITSFLFAFLLLLPNIICSALLTKVVTTTLVKVFASKDTDNHKNEVLTGRMCTVLLDCTFDKMGQAQVVLDSSSFTINVLATKEGFNPTKGEECLVVDYDPEKKIYIIEPVII